MIIYETSIIKMYKFTTEGMQIHRGLILHMKCKEYASSISQETRIICHDEFGLLFECREHVSMNYG